MKMKLIFLIIILLLKGFPQSDGLDTLNNLQKTLPLITNNTSLLRYSVASSELFQGSTNLNLLPTASILIDEVAARKSPWLAFGLSLLYPGLGQLYNAEYGKALLMGGLGTLGLGLAMLAAMSTDFDSESNPNYIGVMLYSGVAIYGGVYLWSMIDAPISASNINERNRKLGVTIFSTEDETFTLRLRSGKELSSTSLNFSFNF